MSASEGNALTIDLIVTSRKIKSVCVCVCGNLTSYLHYVNQFP
jgi:hypothetical protein